MSYSASSLFKLRLIDAGTEDNLWGDYVNALFQRLEQSIAGEAAVTISGSNVTLNDDAYTGTQSHKAMLALSGTQTADVDVLVPARTKVWLVKNETVDDGNGPWTVTVKVSGQTGVSLAHGEFALLYCDGTDVETIIAAGQLVTSSSALGTDNVLVRADGTGRAVQATGIVISDSDVVTNAGQVRWVKGADVASGSALPVLADGNIFDVTGTTTVTSIDTMAAGTVIVLHFDGALTLTHHATDLVLPAGRNITTAAGDEAIFYEYATGDWRCLSFIRADGLPLASPYGMAFNAGFDADNVKEDIAAQTWGEIVVDQTGSFTGEAGYIDTAPTGQAAIVDIEKNGTTIYATKPQFDAAANSLTAGTLKTDGTEDFVAGDRITFKVTQVGSSEPGEGLRFTASAVVYN